MTAEVKPESCPECGFVWEAVRREEIGRRIGGGARRIIDQLVADPEGSARRPSPLRWSSLEYGAHVRDVLLHLRDRIVIGLVEDRADFKPLYREQRVDLGLYAGDHAAIVSDELAMAARLFGRTFDRIPQESLERICLVTYPTVTERKVLWIAQQAVHEVEHHATDVEENSPRAR